MDSSVLGRPGNLACTKRRSAARVEGTCLELRPSEGHSGYLGAGPVEFCLVRDALPVVAGGVRRFECGDLVVGEDEFR